MKRQALTLLEVLVVICIIGVLLALLLPAIQRIRLAASRTAGSNHLRQIVLSVHHFSSTHDGYLPSFDGNIHSKNSGHSVFTAILPYIERTDLYQAILEKRKNYPQENIDVKIFLNPLDPTIPTPKPGAFTAAHCSYPANAYALDGNPSMTATFLDGTSTTIMFAEQYCVCNYAHFIFFLTEVIVPPYAPARRSAFADGGRAGQGKNERDYYPITQGNPPISRAEANLTFQCAPPLMDCEPRLPNTPFSGGITTAMADGSIRFFARDVSPHIFWGAVTPSSGELE